MHRIAKVFQTYITSVEPFWTLALVPIWQEVVFRYLPFKFWYLPTGNFWLVGIVSSLAFAAIHWYFGKVFVIYAFLWGVILWFVMVKFGLLAVILLHAFINLADLILGIRGLLMKLRL